MGDHLVTAVPWDVEWQFLLHMRIAGAQYVLGAQ